MIDDDDDYCGASGGMNDWQEKPKYSEKTCPSATPATEDPTLDFPRSVTWATVVGSWQQTA
jgi:hypothetical protein